MSVFAKKINPGNKKYYINHDIGQTPQDYYEWS